MMEFLVILIKGGDNELQLINIIIIGTISWGKISFRLVLSKIIIICWIANEGTLFNSQLIDI